MASSEMVESDGDQDPSPGEENIPVWETAEIAIVTKGTLVLSVCDDCFREEEEVEQVHLEKRRKKCSMKENTC